MTSSEAGLYEFGPFRVDASERQLSCDGEPIALTDKVFELLLALLRQRGRIASKSELLERIWPDTAVQENNLTVNVSILRKALGDSVAGEEAGRPRYIQTVARRGYRFVAEVREVARPQVGPGEGFSEPAEPAGPAAREARASFVGRKPELDRLDQLLHEANAGARRIVFISGSAGMGKTALAEHFCERALACTPTLLLARGRCLEQYGPTEAYLPFLEALAGLLVGPASDVVAAALSEHAPSWCGHFPQNHLLQRHLLHGRAAAELERRGALAVSRQSVLREMRDALAALSARFPVLLLLEDLHWADSSSVELLHFIARSESRQQLLVLATLRPEPLDLGDSPLKNVRRELSAHDRSEDLPLACLTEAQISSYLARAFGAPDGPSELCAWLLRQTEGQPLFVTRLVQLLLEEGALSRSGGGLRVTRPLGPLQRGLPDSLRGVIDKKLESLREDDRRALMYASVQGEEFSSLVLAETLGADELSLEERLDKLWRVHRLIQPAGDERFSDGQLGVRYRFTHVLYQNALYEALAKKSRWLLHRQIAEKLLAHQAALAPRLGQLALHFEAGLDFERAYLYSLKAGDSASRLHADREAEQHYARGLTLVQKLPADRRLAREIILHYNHGWVSFNLSDFGVARADFEAMLARAQSFEQRSPDHDAERGLELEAVFDYFEQPWGDAFSARQEPRMLNQPRSLGASAIACEALFALATLSLYSGHAAELGEAAREMLRLAEASQNAPRRAEALGWMGSWHLAIGDRQAAKALLDAGRELAQTLGHSRALYTWHKQRAMIHWLEGELELALSSYQQLRTLTYEAGGVIDCLNSIGLLHAQLGHLSDGLNELERAAGLAEEAGLKLFSASIFRSVGRVYRELGAFERALDQDQRSLELARESGSIEDEIDAWLSLFETHSLRDEGAAARGALLEAERLLCGQGEVETTRACLLRLRLEAAKSKHAQSLGAFELAEQSASALLAAATRERLHEPTLLGHQALARARLARGDLLGSRAELARALELLAERPLPSVEWQLWALLAELEGISGNAAAMGAAYRRAGAGLDLLAASIAEEELRQTFAASPSVRQVRDAARAAAPTTSE